MTNEKSNRGSASMDESNKQHKSASKGDKTAGDHASHDQRGAANRQSSGGTHEQHVKAGQQSHKNT